jgi:hypothetical protein
MGLPFCRADPGKPPHEEPVHAFSRPTMENLVRGEALELLTTPSPFPEVHRCDWGQPDQTLGIQA